MTLSGVDSARHLLLNENGPWLLVVVVVVLLVVNVLVVPGLRLLCNGRHIIPVRTYSLDQLTRTVTSAEGK